MSLEEQYSLPEHPGSAGRLATLLEGRRVLVTGAGGSVGVELCRLVLGANPEQLILLGHGEHSLFQLQRQLAPQMGAARLETAVADVRNRARMRRLMSEFRPNLVLHSAAHKHVPMMETNVAEAVTNNIAGTWVVAEASLEHPGTALLLLSTDKAVRPASVMGATKQIAEGLVRCLGRDAGAPLGAIRFGNVLGSRGSVVPILEEQLRSGGPVLLTDPAMRRYFITAWDAARLILEAAGMMQGAELFVTVMGKAIPIVTLAEDVIREAGKVPGRDVEIRFTGARPGEKIDEEPFFDPALTDDTAHPRLRLARDEIPSREWVEVVGELVRLAERERSETELREMIGNLASDCVLG